MQGRTAENPKTDGQIFSQVERNKTGWKASQKWWFLRRAKQILNQKNPGHESRFSNIGLSDFRIGTSFHFEEKLAARKKHQVI